MCLKLKAPGHYLTYKDLLVGAKLFRINNKKLFGFFMEKPLELTNDLWALPAASIQPVEIEFQVPNSDDVVHKATSAAALGYHIDSIDNWCKMGEYDDSAVYLLVGFRLDAVQLAGDSVVVRTFRILSDSEIQYISRVDPIFSIITGYSVKEAVDQQFKVLSIIGKES